MKASSASMERVVLVKPQNTTVRPTRGLYTASRSAATPRHSVQAGSRITCARGHGLGASKNIGNEQQDQGKQQVQENQNAATAAGTAQHASAGRDLGHGGVEQLDERHPEHHLAPIPGQIIAFFKSHLGHPSRVSGRAKVKLKRMKYSLLCRFFCHVLMYFCSIGMFVLLLCSRSSKKRKFIVLAEYL